jgi:hypothetical protein
MFMDDIITPAFSAAFATLSRCFRLTRDDLLLIGPPSTLIIFLFDRTMPGGCNYWSVHLLLNFVGANLLESHPLVRIFGPYRTSTDFCPPPGTEFSATPDGYGYWRLAVQILLQLATLRALTNVGYFISAVANMPPIEGMPLLPVLPVWAGTQWKLWIDVMSAQRIGHMMSMSALQLAPMWSRSSAAVTSENWADLQTSLSSGCEMRVDVSAWLVVCGIYILVETAFAVVGDDVSETWMGCIEAVGPQLTGICMETLLPSTSSSKWVQRVRSARRNWRLGRSRYHGERLD